MSIDDIDKSEQKETKKEGQLKTFGMIGQLFIFLSL